MSKPSAIAHADIDALVAQLTVEESIALSTGVGNWYTAAIPRLDIPSIKVTDGPNGARGSRYFLGTPSKCLPCATALAATFDTDLVALGAAQILAPECRLKAAGVLLGPTCNIQRSPLGGRSFESFSEDPHLNGMMAAFYISALQAEGISACIKHFVCNDQEQERKGSDSLVPPRALREVYLYPFMLAQKFARPWSYMTAYNRLNGVHCSEHPELLDGILRKEWGFDGLIMSDWRGVYSVEPAYNAGLDLEMPGTDGWRNVSKVVRQVQANKLSPETVKARARAVLELVKRVAGGAPEILDGDQAERTADTEAEKAAMRTIAASSIVLLKNSASVLPLDASKLKSIAIVGPNAKAGFIAGGGSASLKASYTVTPYEGIVAALGEGVEVRYAEGCQAHKRAPTLERELVTESGEPGLTGTFYSVLPSGALSPPVQTVSLTDTDLILNDSPIFFTPDPWQFVLSGQFRPRTRRTTFQFGLSVAGRAKLYVDGKLVIDNWTRQRRGESFFGDGTEEETGTVELLPGVAHAVRLEYCNLRGPADGDEDESPNPHAGLRLGGFEVWDEEEAMREAEEVARGADAVVVVVGLNGDWESEGYDRKALDLPRRTNELVARVARANPRNVVVTQAGSAFTMPWIDSVSSLIHAWYLGNETGNAIADVLFGRVNPSGRMSMTFPKALKDVPSYLNFGNENGKVRYVEGLFVGYKHYQSRGIEPLFPFGFGLSYTTFQYTDLRISKPSGTDASFEATVRISVKNTGKVVGSEAVQLYISLPAGHLTHPRMALKAFTKLRDIKPGEEATATLKLDKYAVSYFDDRLGKWRADKGRYEVLVGASSEDVRLRGVLELDGGFVWTGL